MTPYLFVFGTLRDPILLALVSGMDNLHEAARPATAAGWCVEKVRDQVFPAIRTDQDGVAHGLLLSDVPAQAMARLNFFETAFGYSLQMADVDVETTCVQAEIYVPDRADAQTDGPWDFALWQRLGRAQFLEVASEIMSVYTHQTQDNLPVNVAAIAVRAHARLRAKIQPYQTGMRHSFTSSDVEVKSLTQPYSKFFAVQEFALTHPKFDGTRSDILRREVFASGDAVSVLPYDPRLDKVVLIEQFRVGAFARGDRKPWLLEAVAGRIEVGQTPEEAALREAEEEAGLTISRLEKISEYYTTPGAYNEYIYSYIGCVDLSGFERDFHGLASEYEDIATHLVAVDDLISMMTTGQINNSPLVISALWLALNRDRLQKDWTGA